ncbi:MAG: ABC transporter substrate-binding protein [bacterium]
MRGSPFRARTLFVVGLLGIAIAGCGGSTASQSPAGVASGAATSSASASAVGFAPPNLTGQTLNFVLGSAPTQYDTHYFIMQKVLRSWGAQVSLIHVNGSSATGHLLLAGQADISKDPLSAIITDQTVTFGPGQPSLEFVFIGGKNLSDVHDLPGHKVGLTSTHGLEFLLLSVEEKVYNIDPESVTKQIAGGGQSARATQLLAGQIDAMLAHYALWPILQPQGMHLLGELSKDAPTLADGFIHATGAWLTAHPDLAAAIDEAWLVASKEFQTDEAAWVADEQAFMGASKDSIDSAQSAWQVAHDANLWPYDKTAFSADSIVTNIQASAPALTTSPPPPAQISTTTYWDQAVKAIFP